MDSTTYDHPNELTSRTEGGSTVSLSWLPLMNMAVVTVTSDGEPQARSFEDRAVALDAYKHPALYFPMACGCGQCRSLVTA